MLASPLHYDKLMRATIDLSQLVEVGDAFFAEEWDHHQPVVGFRYRYAQTPSDKPLVYCRDLIMGPSRNSDLSLRNSNEVIDTALEERYYVLAQREAGVIERSGSGWIIIYEEDDPTKPKALTRMEAQIESLREAWAKWKAAEPEIYALIRKHLS